VVFQIKTISGYGLKQLFLPTPIHSSPLVWKEPHTFFFSLPVNVFQVELILSQAPNQGTISPSRSDWFRNWNRAKLANESIQNFFLELVRKDVFSVL